jgi:hypothetical protein
MMNTLFLIFGYLWRLAVNLIFLSIVIHLLISSRGRFEITIVALLGVIYSTLRTIALAQANSAVTIVRGLALELRQIRKLLNDEPEPLDDETQRKIDHATYKNWLDMFFCWVVWISCVWMLATN